MSFELKVLLLSIAVTVYLIIFNTLQHKNLSFYGNSTRWSVKFLLNDNNVSLKEVLGFCMLTEILKYQNYVSQTLQTFLQS